MDFAYGTMYTLDVLRVRTKTVSAFGARRTHRTCKPGRSRLRAYTVLNGAPKSLCSPPMRLTAGQTLVNLYVI
jgi:hypothetical protein